MVQQLPVGDRRAGLQSTWVHTVQRLETPLLLLLRWLVFEARLATLARLVVEPRKSRLLVETVIDEVLSGLLDAKPGAGVTAIGLPDSSLYGDSSSRERRSRAPSGATSSSPHQLRLCSSEAACEDHVVYL